MTKFFTGWIIIISVFNIFPQESDNQIKYSESIPYQPREFKDKKNNIVDARGKRINEKKEKTSTSTINQSPGSRITKVFRIPVFVRDTNDSPTLDLKKEDFQLFVNDKEINIDSLDNKEPFSDLVLLIDNSYITKDDNLPELKQFASLLVEKLAPSFKIKIISFSERLKVRSEFSDDKSKLLDAIKKIKNSSGTSLFDAVAHVLEKEAVSQAKILLLTDGVDTTSWKYSYEKSLLQVEQSESAIVAIFIPSFYRILSYEIVFPMGSAANILTGGLSGGVPIERPSSIPENDKKGFDYMTDLWTISGGQGIILKNFTPGVQLSEAAMNLLADRLRPQYYLEFSLSKESNSTIERKQIRLRVKRPNLTIQTRGSLRF